MEAGFSLRDPSPGTLQAYLALFQLQKSSRHSKTVRKGGIFQTLAAALRPLLLLLLHDGDQRTLHHFPGGHVHPGVLNGHIGLVLSEHGAFLGGITHGFKPWLRFIKRRDPGNAVVRPETRCFNSHGLFQLAGGGGVVRSAGIHLDPESLGR